MAVQEIATKEITMKDLLTDLIKLGGSDLHIVVGVPPIVRLDGRCEKLPGYPRLMAEQTQELIYSVMKEDQIAAF